MSCIQVRHLKTLITFTLIFELRKCNHTKGQWQSNKSQYFSTSHIATTTDVTAEKNLEVGVTRGGPNSTFWQTTEKDLPNEKDPVDGSTTNSATFPTLKSMRDLDSCIEYGTCELAFKHSKVWFCKCDELCTFYDDCCPAYDSTNSSSTFTEDMSMANTQTKYKFECTSISKPDTHRGVQIINQCPQHMTGSDIDIKCSTSYIPSVGPWVIDGDGMVYQNMFCAQCHDANNTTHFGLRIYDLTDEVLEKLLNTNWSFLEKINYIYEKHRNVHLKQVEPQGTTVRSCLVYTPTDDTECGNYFINPVIQHRSIWRNQFCMPDRNDSFLCAINQTLTEESDVPSYLAFPLSMLFIPQNPDAGCQSNENKYCLDGVMYQNYRFGLHIGIVAPDIWPEQQLKQLVGSFLKSFSKDITIGGYICENKTDILTQIAAVCTFIIILHQETDTKDIQVYKEYIENYKWQNSVTYTDGTIVRTYIIHTNKTEYTDNPLIRMNEVPLNFPNDVIVVPARQFSSCFDLRLESEFNSTHLLIKEIICLNLPTFIQVSMTISLLKTIITYTGMTLSVIALSISIAIYRMTRMCKSVPGSNVENISVALLIFNIVFLLGVGANDYALVCYSVGVFLHYLWLTLFSYKSLTLLYMSYNLTKALNVSHPLIIKARRRKTTIVGLLLPVPIVMASVLLDSLGQTGINANYGGSVCFPTGFHAHMIFVTAPIGLSVLVNVCCFIVIGGVITKQSFVTRNIRKSSSYQHIPIFARMSAVTGLFWMIGILWQFFPSEILEYSFLVTCSLQGVLVAITNVSTKRVVKKLRKQISKTST